MSPSVVYLVISLDNICNFFGGICGILMTLSLIFGLIILCADACEQKELSKRWFPRVMTGTIITLLLAVVLPNTKQAAAMWVIPKMYNAITTNEKAVQLPDKIVGLADAWLEELKPKQINPKTKEK